MDIINWPTLEDAYAAALNAAQLFSDAAHVEETNWTGWGDGEVPHVATMRRVKADQALRALRDAGPVGLSSP